MTAKQPRPRSRCANCGGAYRDHSARELACPHGAGGGTWQPPLKKASLRRSFSYSPAELTALAEVLAAVERKDTRKALSVASVRRADLQRVLGRLQR